MGAVLNIFTLHYIIDSGHNNRVINLGMYEDYFIKEIIPLTYKTFNTIKDRKGRYIEGASVGGYVDLRNTFRHQHMFSKVGGDMHALELRLEDEDKPYVKRHSKIHSRISLNHTA